MSGRVNLLWHSDLLKNEMRVTSDRDRQWILNAPALITGYELERMASEGSRESQFKLCRPKRRVSVSQTKRRMDVATGLVSGA